MSNASRPDIQVLESRVDKIRSQILQYKDIRVYGITRKRLAVIASELEECLVVLDEVAHASKLAEPEPIELKEPEQIIHSKEDFEDDLSDVILSASLKSTSSNDSENYEPKMIVSTYSKKMRELSGTATGIIQVNQFCGLLNSWYQARFNPETRNPRFRYKSNRIHEWIDLMIIAYGESLHNKVHMNFKSDLDTWIETLNTSKDENWVLPKCVADLQKNKADRITKEAILIEKIVKNVLYSEVFYPAEMNSIEKIVINSNKFTEEEITIDALLQSCNGIIVTSSFDASKY